MPDICDVNDHSNLNISTHISVFKEKRRQWLLSITPFLFCVYSVSTESLLCPLRVR